METTKALLEDLSKLRADHGVPDPLPKEATSAEQYAHALHCDAVAHLDNAINALQRSIAGER